MLSNLLSRLLKALGIGGVGLGATIGAAWFFGLMPILGAVANVVAAVVAPIAGAAVTGVVWLWQSVLWPGICDVFDSWVTIATVALSGALLWGWLAGTYEVRIAHAKSDLRVCQATLVKAKKGVPPTTPEQPFTFKWPWD